MNKAANGDKDADNEEKIRDDRVERNEITKLICMYDKSQLENDEEEQKNKDFIIGVGWDKKIHIWSDDKDEIVETLKTLPQNKQQGHKTDIMSCCYYYKDNIQMIYTGGHDGSLISWSLETGSAKRQLHEKDPTCLSSNKDQLQAIKESKSVDALLILEVRQRLLSMTADQWLRFWDLNELTTDNQPSFKFHCKHPRDDQLTACAVTNDNNTIVTADTSGQMKIWDITDVKLDDQSTECYFIEKVFIIAHKAMINTI